MVKWKALFMWLGLGSLVVGSLAHVFPATFSSFLGTSVYAGVTVQKVAGVIGTYVSGKAIYDRVKKR